MAVCRSERTTKRTGKHSFYHTAKVTPPSFQVHLSRKHMGAVLRNEFFNCPYSLGVSRSSTCTRPISEQPEARAIFERGRQFVNYKKITRKRIGRSINLWLPLPLWHVEVVDMHDELLAGRRSEYALPSLLHFGVHHVLGHVRGRLG